MSIITEINRLSQAKSDLKIVIENKGVSIPSNVKIDEYYKYIDLKYLPLTFEILSSGDIYFYCDGNSIQYSKNGGEWTNLTGVYNQLYTISLTVEGKSGTYTYGGYDSQNMGMCYWENGNDRVYNDGLYCYNNYVYDSSYNNYYILTCQNAIMPYTTSMTVEGKSGTYTYGGYDNNRMYMYYWENGNDRVYNNYYYVTTNDSVKDNNYNRYNVLTTQNEIIRGIPVVNGDIVQFRGNSPLCTFRCTSCEFNVYGNIMSLVNSTNFANLTTITNSEYFYNLFKDISGLLNAENLILPATTLADYCYGNMFFGCTSLTTAPSILPANTLADNCYNYMFSGCTSLTSVPALPATTLARNCYGYMFQNCTSLTTAPELPATTLEERCYEGMFCDCTSLIVAPALPATTLADSCYSSMFNGCTNLTTAPALPATTLAGGCYCYMFFGCSSLTTAPELPATTLVEGCYEGMFKDCTSLEYIKCLATTITGTDDWVDNVSDIGIFSKDADTVWEIGSNGIPSGWTIKYFGFGFDKKTITLYETGGTEQITVISVDNSWTATPQNNWITLSQNSGSAGETTISVTVSSTSSSRTGSVVFSDGSKSVTLNVVQNDYLLIPLTFEITKSGTIYWGKEGYPMESTIQYKLNNGTLTNLTPNNSISVTTGDVVEFYGIDVYSSGYDTSSYYTFGNSTAEFNVKGNIMSLIKLYF